MLFPLGTLKFKLHRETNVSLSTDMCICCQAKTGMRASERSKVLQTDQGSCHKPLSRLQNNYVLGLAISEMFGNKPQNQIFLEIFCLNWVLLPTRWSQNQDVQEVGSWFISDKTKQQHSPDRLTSKFPGEASFLYKHSTYRAGTWNVSGSQLQLTKRYQALLISQTPSHF